MLGGCDKRAEHQWHWYREWDSYSNNPWPRGSKAAETVETCWGRLADLASEALKYCKESLRGDSDQISEGQDADRNVDKQGQDQDHRH